MTIIHNYFFSARLTTFRKKFSGGCRKGRALLFFQNVFCAVAFMLVKAILGIFLRIFIITLSLETLAMIEPAEISGTFSSPLIIVSCLYSLGAKRTVHQHQIRFPGKFFQNFLHAEYNRLPYANLSIASWLHKNMMAFKFRTFLQNLKPFFPLLCA